MSTHVEHDDEDVVVVLFENYANITSNRNCSAVGHRAF